ncbi:hypothetical protein [uncultured Winogradskyella sp.]|uniref:hypothetical protein n=1 Tax=uncultured Winogradskyella sp. TaxID=395353 RepID=UPI0026080A9A|nr:hypothetical protein [uncultured Winogradskyella sp.]
MKMICYFIITLILFSCKNSEKQNKPSGQIDEVEFKVDSILNAQNFNKTTQYEAISLVYNGKPLVSLGQKIEQLDPTLSFRDDPNGDFWNKTYLIKDHLSMDKNLSMSLSKGSINGILFFSSDQIDHQIFNISGGWTIEAEVTKENESEVVNEITKLFPCLKNNLELREDWEYINKKEKYIEYFIINSSKENNGVFWTMNYDVKIKKRSSNGGTIK